MIPAAPTLPVRVIALLALVLPAGLTQAAHPLITEDTATQGQGHSQIELVAEHTRIRRSGAEQYQALTSATLSYGFAESADIIFTLPYLRLGQSALTGAPAESGFADTGLDLKWRFYEQGRLSLALKPGLTFASGDETRNLGTGETTWSAYLTSSYNPAPWTFHLHLGHLHHNNTFNEREDIWHASAAVARQFGDSLQLVLDAGVDTNTDRQVDSDPVFAIIGMIWSPHRQFDIDAGFKIDRTDAHRSRALLAGLAWRW